MIVKLCEYSTVNSTLRFALFFIFLPIACQSSSNVGSDKNNEIEEWVDIRILSYNIFHGEKTNGEIDMDVFASIISEHDPDLVALQEVDKGVSRSNYLDITQELSERTGLNGYFIKHRDYREGEYGQAILSKYPIENIDIKGSYSTSTYIKLPFAKVNITDDKFIHFNTSHLSTDYNDRSEQTKQLANYYNEELNQGPLIIAGDLNAEPESSEMDILLEQFEMSDQRVRNTFSTRSGMRKKIDYVLYPNNGNWEVQETMVTCRKDASDHCALLAVLRYSLNKN